MAEPDLFSTATESAIQAATPTSNAAPVMGTPPEAKTAPEALPHLDGVKVGLIRGEYHEDNLIDRLVPDGIKPDPAADAFIEQEKAAGRIIDDIAPRAKTSFDPCYMIFDTETSDIVAFDKPADAEGQGRLCQLAMIHVNIHLDIVKKEVYYVKPDGWRVSPGAFQSHGLTEEFLEQHGRPVREVLEKYAAAIDDGRILIAHHAQFDMKIMRGEMRRAGMPDRFEDTPNACTMRSSTGVCRIPQKNRGGYKWPKLEEVCRHFGISYSDGHDAEHDAMCCYHVFCRLMKIGALQTPQVHYARTKIEPVYPAGSGGEAAKVSGG